MKILAVDPGAERCGWAIIEGVTKGPYHIDSGVFEFHRGDLDFQPYRMQLEQDIVHQFDVLINQYEPDGIINEIIPAVGGGNFAVATQSYLANCTVTALHVVAYLHDVHYAQVSARTWQSKIGIKNRNGKITKVGVRNGILHHFPKLEPYKKVWPADRWDAIGIGLHTCGRVTKL